MVIMHWWNQLSVVHTIEQRTRVFVINAVYLLALNHWQSSNTDQDERLVHAQQPTVLPRHEG